MTSRRGGSAAASTEWFNAADFESPDFNVNAYVTERTRVVRFYPLQRVILRSLARLGFMCISCSNRPHCDRSACHSIRPFVYELEV